MIWTQEKMGAAGGKVFMRGLAVKLRPYFFTRAFGRRLNSMRAPMRVSRALEFFFSVLSRALLDVWWVLAVQDGECIGRQLVSVGFASVRLGCVAMKIVFIHKHRVGDPP